MKSIYECEKCGTQYETIEECFKCEETHVGINTCYMYQRDLEKYFDWGKGDVMPMKMAITSDYIFDGNDASRVKFGVYTLDHILNDEETESIISNQKKRDDLEKARWEQVVAERELENSQKSEESDSD